MFAYLLTDANTTIVPAPGSFLFSLLNHDDLPPFRALLTDDRRPVIYRDVKYGPSFGEDLRIGNIKSLTNFGDCFQTPSGYAFQESATQSLLAGSLYFEPVEIEVLYMK